MPDIWLNIAMVNASRMTLRCSLTKNGTEGALAADASEELISWIWRSASSRVWVSRPMTSRPSSSRPLAMSQRGVSGTAISMIRKITAGTAMTPNIQRQSVASSLMMMRMR